jgi:phosphoribosylaminoimidazole-succinocarboxamide synthase
MQALVGVELAETLRQRSLDVYTVGAHHAHGGGIILADTKFEFGVLNGDVLLIDEVMTPDSSRFWPADGYKAGGSGLRRTRSTFARACGRA